MKIMRSTFLLIALCMHAVPVVSDNAAADAGGSATVLLKIDDMATSQCTTLVRTAVGKVDGVLAVDASLPEKIARIQYNPRETDVASIRGAIEDQAGFASEVVE